MVVVFALSLSLPVSMSPCFLTPVNPISCQSVNIQADCNGIDDDDIWTISLQILPPDSCELNLYKVLQYQPHWVVQLKLH